MRMTTLFGALVASAGLIAAPGSAQARTGPRFMIVDNDFGVPTSGIQAVPVVTSPDVVLLGLTTVAGDSYVTDDVMHTLRFLEIIGRTDVPVNAGANQPLLRTRAELEAWERHYGTVPWKGVWNASRPGHPVVGPTDVQPIADGPPRHTAAPGHAVAFLIDQVRAHPGAISIVASGPLTNIALAIRLDPGFAANVRDITILGGLVDTSMKRITDDANFNTDFNFLFDPEAADIVLTADFPKIRIVSGVANSVRLTPTLLGRITAVRTPLSDYYARFSLKGLPLWDEMAAAIALDPTLVTHSTSAYMRVDLTRGMHYGMAHVWPGATRPHLGEREVEVVDRIDTERFMTLMTRSLQTGAVIPARRP